MSEATNPSATARSRSKASIGARSWSSGLPPITLPESLAFTATPNRDTASFSEMAVTSAPFSQREFLGAGARREVKFRGHKDTFTAIRHLRPDFQDANRRHEQFPTASGGP